MNRKKTVKDLADKMHMTVNQLAEKAGIDPGHLKRVSEGRAKMKAADLLQLAYKFNISIYDIETGRVEQNG
jgi:transcriptional regulator with XRE-family HTH domain